MTTRRRREGCRPPRRSPRSCVTLEALHDEAVHEQARHGLVQGRALVEQLVRQAIADGHIDSHCDPATETNLLLALTGFAPLIELDVIRPLDALAAIDLYLDRLFSGNDRSA
ncbi:hypothetical protein [Nonomuraea sp. NPDC003709]|uniref:hypothetical protein n=1 Tax=Nonomuraea sp. NPDC003709 TaxID=3154450 RepID=UPI0033AECB5A